MRVVDFSGQKIIAACYREAPVMQHPCVTATVGNCLVSECRFSANGAANPTPVLRDSGGIVTVTGNLADGTRASITNESWLAPQPQGTGASEADWKPVVFAEGTPMEISASGRLMPAFQVTLNAPRPIRLTQPATQSFFDVVSVSTSKPLTVAWEGNAQATVIAHVGASQTLDGWTQLVSAECVMGASPSTIPAEVLARVATVPMSNGNGVTFGLGMVNQTTFVAGEYDVTVEAAASAGGFARLELKP